MTNGNDPSGLGGKANQPLQGPYLSLSMMMTVINISLNYILTHFASRLVAIAVSP